MRYLFISLLMFSIQSHSYNQWALVSGAQSVGIPADKISFVVSYIDKYKTSIKNLSHVVFVDFSLPSTDRRAFLINTDTGSVFKFLVSHGENSGQLYATDFSNEHDTHKSSLGLYYTMHTYVGNYGTSLKIKGLQTTNSNAFDRWITIHPAPYATDKYIQEFGMLGLSEGCFAIDPSISLSLISKIKDGSLWLAFN